MPVVPHCIVQSLSLPHDKILVIALVGGTQTRGWHPIRILDWPMKKAWSTLRVISKSEPIRILDRHYLSAKTNQDDCYHHSPRLIDILHDYRGCLPHNNMTKDQSHEKD